MITRKLMSAAFAVASIATLSLGAGGEAQARGGHSGGGSGMRASFSGKFSGGQGMIRRADGHRFHRFHRFGYGYGYNGCWKWTPAGLVNICRVLPY